MLRGNAEATERPEYGDTPRTSTVEQLRVRRARAAWLAVSRLGVNRPTPVAEEWARCRRDLVGAMQAALSDHDEVAAETLALECLRGIDQRAGQVRSEFP